MEPADKSITSNFLKTRLEDSEERLRAAVRSSQLNFTQKAGAPGSKPSCPDKDIQAVLELELDAKEFIIDEINVLVQAASRMELTEPFARQVKIIALEAIEHAVGILEPSDRHQVNLAMLASVADKAAAHWLDQTLPSEPGALGISVRSPRAEKEEYCDYPKGKYSWNRKHAVVTSLEEEKALGAGWTDDPVVCEEYERSPRTMPTNDDLPKWVDCWDVVKLSSDVKQLIKASILSIAADFWAHPDGPDAHLQAMQWAFDEIAKVLFNAGVLKQDLMQNEIPCLVWDTAVAGGWWPLAAGTRTEIFPDRIGHYWGWLARDRDWEGLFRSEILRWRGQLLGSAVRSPAIRQDGHVKQSDSIESALLYKQPTDRQMAVDAYIDEVFRVTGKRITRTEIWKAAGYANRTEFERWETNWYERRGGKGNQAADHAFRRVLTEKPHLNSPKPRLR